ncbi:NAD-dependent epimerase/dehydratase family protein [Salinarimonas sp.]|uniref:NAD-dependent epimerase/dehydratase family protein n=1 Tax=Salinarimonas sp. TaxID=2766526 RepID=UPI0032D919F5
MNVLVLGGSGFVGSALVPALREAGFAVTLANRGTRRVPHTRQIVLDRDDERSVAALGAPDAPAFDLVVDTSAYTGPQAARARTALAGRVGRWIHLGSAAVYADGLDRAPREDDPIGGAAVWGAYGLEKSDADRIHLAAEDGVPTAILRPPYLYGPGNDNDRETFVFARALTGRPIVVPGAGAAPLQFLHVADLAAIVVALARVGWSGVEIYNVAEAQTVGARDWVELLCEIAGARPPILLGGEIDPRQPPRSYFPFRDAPCIVDAARFAASDLATRPRPHARGFAETFASYRLEDLRVASPTTPGEATLLAKAGLGQGGNGQEGAS